MSEKQPLPPELAAIAQSFDTTQRLMDDVTDLKSRLETSQHQVEMTERRAEQAEHENGILRHQIKQATIERDRYFRWFTGLQAQFESIAGAMATAIRATRAQTEGRPPRPATGTEVVTTPPVNDEPTEAERGRVNFKELAAAIGLQAQ